MGVQGQAGLDRPRLFDRSCSSFFCLLFDFSSLLPASVESPSLFVGSINKRQNTMIAPLWHGQLVYTV
jgi:hypothetical protein